MSNLKIRRGGVTQPSAARTGANGDESLTRDTSRWLAVGLAWCLLGAAPDPATPPSRLASRVAEAVANAWRIEPAAVRLEWPRATALSEVADPESPIRLAGRGTDGWFVVIVSPPGADPIAARVRAGTEGPVRIATRPLAAGSHIEAGDLEETRRLRWGPPTAADLPDVGWQIRRALSAGDAVAAPVAVEPSLIANGDRVQLVWERHGVSLSMSGIALHSARRGEPIRARVEGRDRPVTATVVGRGVAEFGEASR